MTHELTKTLQDIYSLYEQGQYDTALKKIHQIEMELKQKKECDQEQKKSSPS